MSYLWIRQERTVRHTHKSSRTTRSPFVGTSEPQDARVLSSIPRTIAEIMRLFAASPTQCRNFFFSWFSHGRALWRSLLEILFSGLHSPLAFNPVTVGDNADSQAVSVSRTLSLSSLTESWTEVYSRWQRNKLTCKFLRDYTASPDLDSYFTYTRLDQTACSDVATPFVSPSSTVPSSLLSPTRSSLLSTGTSSQPSGPTEGPLTPSASRVVGDGNGARPPVARSAEFPGFALYLSVFLIVSPFFL